MKLHSDTYNHYKESEGEWADKVPSEWQERRVKDLFRMVTQSAPANNGYELLSLYASIGVRPRKDLEARGNKASSTDGYWIVKKNDIVVNKLLAWMGAVGLSEYDGVTSPAYDVLRKVKPDIEPRYFAYLFRTETAKKIFRKNSRGIMDMRLRLYFDKLGAITVPVPPYLVQRDIADYIDIKATQIDKKIDFLQQKILLINKLKSSIINETIKKGVGNSFPLKDSGVKFLGAIPNNWLIKRGVDFLSLINQQVSTAQMAGRKVFHYSIPVVQSTGSGRFENGDDIDSGKSQIFGEELLYSKLNPRKQTSCLTHSVPTGQLTVASGEFLVLKPKRQMATLKFCYYLFLADFNKQRICSTVKSVTRSHERANPNDIHKLSFPLPPINEQNEITSYIDEKVLVAESAINKIERNIEKLNQLRIAMINDAVIGEIKVGDVTKYKGQAA